MLDEPLPSVIVALMIVSASLTRDAVAAEPKSADYAALSEAILEGKEPRMLIDLSACQVHGADIAGPPIKASIRFDGYMIQADGTIAFATTHMTREVGQVGQRIPFVQGACRWEDRSPYGDSRRCQFRGAQGVFV